MYIGELKPPSTSVASTKNPFWQIRCAIIEHRYVLVWIIAKRWKQEHSRLIHRKLF